MAKAMTAHPLGGLERAKRRAGLLFAAPAVLHFLIFTSIPVFAAIGLSFTNYSPLGGGHWIGLGNYVKMASDRVFWIAVKNTTVYSVWTVPLCIAIALGMAIAVNEGIRAKAFYRVAFYMPQVTATVVIAVVWMFIYNEQFGMLNFLLEKLGLHGKNWLSDQNWALPSVIGMAVWRGVGQKMIIYLAALQGIPDYLYEAARIDGANSWQMFRRVTVPLLAPATFFITVTALIESFQVFESIYVMTQGGPVNATTTIGHQIYQQAFEFTKMGYASAEAVFLAVVIFIITLINMKYVKGEVDYV